MRIIIVFKDGCSIYIGWIWYLYKGDGYDMRINIVFI